MLEQYGAAFDYLISIHALREEGDVVKLRPELPYYDFYPRPPRGGRRSAGSTRAQDLDISIHALREEGDYTDKTLNRTPGKFLSTPSARRATCHCRFLLLVSCISIHALREEGDGYGALQDGGADRFLSTPSARRATVSAVFVDLAESDFYPRPPRGGRLMGAAKFQMQDKFLSTPSARRATELPKLSSSWIKISIHALREEGDRICLTSSRRIADFYPRPPRGGRPSPFALCSLCRNFYPRPPRGGRRGPGLDPHPGSVISIHALREEGDVVNVFTELPIFDFYPRPPRGGRHAGIDYNALDLYFYPRPPRGGRRA